jgi:predicted nucleic acid-binding protein
LIVVDASALIEVLLDASGASRIADRLFDATETLHAPHLIDVEVAQVMRRYSRSGEIDAVRGMQALDDLHDFQIARYPHYPFLRRIWELRHNVTAYDATYLALAEALAAPLLTRDAKLAASAGHDARVELLR